MLNDHHNISSPDCQKIIPLSSTTRWMRTNSRNDPLQDRRALALVKDVNKLEKVSMQGTHVCNNSMREYERGAISVEQVRDD